MSFIFNSFIDLGDPFDVLAAFKSYAALDNGEDYGELYYVPQTNEEPVDADYVARVANEAQVFSETYGDSLNDHEKWILERLSGPTPTASELASEDNPQQVRNMARRLRR